MNKLIRLPFYWLGVAWRALVWLVMRPEYRVYTRTFHCYNFKDDPCPLGGDYVGKTNSFKFQGNPGNTVLCTSITGEPNKEGDAYDLIIYFRIRVNIYKAYILEPEMVHYFDRCDFTDFCEGPRWEILGSPIYNQKDFCLLLPGTRW